MSVANAPWFIDKGKPNVSLLVEWLCEWCHSYVYDDSTTELNDDDFTVESEWIEYACTLGELHKQISKIDHDLSHHNECNAEKMLNVKKNYLQRFFHLKKKLREPVCTDMELISHLEKSSKIT